MEETKFISKDGKTRVVISQDEYADNPRHMTDEPFHCCDWNERCSVKVKDDPSYSDARSLINQMLVWYGKREVIIDALCKGIDNNRLEYNRSARRWELKEYIKFYGEKEYKWYDAEYFDGRKDEIDLGLLIENCLDSTIDALCDSKYWTDGVKMMSYSFGYYGEVKFDDDFDTSSTGIAWLEKDEFLKYAGGDNSEWIKKEEQVWKEKSLREISCHVDELEAWSNNEVYTISVEHAVRVKSTREYPDGEHETEVKEYIKWEDDDCCGGFYGEYDKMLPFMFEQFGLKQEDFEEVKE